MEPNGHVGSVHDVQPPVAVPLLIVGTMVAVNPWGQWPFGPLRWLVVSVLGVLVCGRCLRDGGSALPRNLQRVWWLLLLSLGFSALAHHDVWVAITGTATRHFGWLTWLLCGGLFAAGARLASSFGHLQRACATACAFVGLWCMWELAFGPPIAVGGDTDRLLGPFGSAAMTGAALCLVLPSAVALALDRNASSTWRVLGGGGAALGALAAIGSGTRAAWVGLVVGGAIVIKAVRPSRRAVLIAGAAVLVALVALSPWARGLADRSEGNTSRLDEWVVGIRVLADHPVLGVGPEGYRLVVGDGIDERYERAHSRDTVLPDRAHSAPLDVALAGGVLAGGAYVVLVWGVWVGSLQRLRRPFDPAAAGVAAGVIAYSAGQVFLFPLAELDPVWWLLAGAIVAVRAPPDHRRLRHQRSAITVAAAVAAAGLFAGGLLDVAANHLAKQAFTAAANGDSAAAIEAAQRAASLRPDSTAYRLVAVQLLLDRGTLRDIDAAIAQANAAVKWAPGDPIAVDLQATALLQRAIATGQDADAAAALGAWLALVEHDPNRARWQLQLGRAAAQADDKDRARSAWTAAAALGSDEAAQLLGELS